MISSNANENIEEIGFVHAQYFNNLTIKKVYPRPVATFMISAFSKRVSFYCTDDSSNIPF